MSDDNRAHAALRDFIAELNTAWEAAGPPSYARLEKLSISFSSSEQAGGLRLRVLAASTTHEILRGKRRSLPEWGWVVSFVNVLRFAAVENGLDPDVVGTIADWKARHQQARMIMRADSGGDSDGDPDDPDDSDGDSDGDPDGDRKGDSDDANDPGQDTGGRRRSPPAERAPPPPAGGGGGGGGGMAVLDAGISGAYPFRTGNRGSRHDGEREREGPAAAGRPARRAARPGGGR